MAILPSSPAPTNSIARLTRAIYLHVSHRCRAAGYEYEVENGFPGALFGQHARRNNQAGFLDVRWLPISRLTLSAGRSRRRQHHIRHSRRSPRGGRSCSPLRHRILGRHPRPLLLWPGTQRAFARRILWQRSLLSPAITRSSQSVAARSMRASTKFSTPRSFASHATYFDNRFPRHRQLRLRSRDKSCLQVKVPARFSIPIWLAPGR